MTTVRNVKITEVINIMTEMIDREIFFMDISIENESTVYFTHSTLPSRDEILGHNIIKSIKPEDNEE